MDNYNKKTLIRTNSYRKNRPSPIIILPKTKEEIISELENKHELVNKKVTPVRNKYFV